MNPPVNTVDWRSAMKQIDRRIRSMGRAATLLAFGWIASGAQALQPDAPSGNSPATIVVVGDAQAVRDSAEQFIQGTGVASGNTPAARWVDPVCPRVLGLHDRGARAAEAKIRTIAAQVGAEVAPEPCDSNIVITFAPDAGSVVREIHRRSPGRLAQISRTRLDALLSGSAPVRWWYAAEVRGRHGERAQLMSGTQGQNTAPSAEMGGGSPFGGAATLLHYENSIVSTLSQRVLVSASVVIDQDEVLGKRLDAVAAYAALVALAEIRSGDFAQEGSILNLFAASRAPLELTAQDTAFLHALYRLPLDRQARRHRGLLVGGMVSAQTVAN
jgi:hypothetical protein